MVKGWLESKGADPRISLREVKGQDVQTNIESKLEDISDNLLKLIKNLDPKEVKIKDATLEEIFNTYINNPQEHSNNPMKWESDSIKNEQKKVMLIKKDLKEARDKLGEEIRSKRLKEFFKSGNISNEDVNQLKKIQNDIDNTGCVKITV